MHMINEDELFERIKLVNEVQRIIDSLSNERDKKIIKGILNLAFPKSPFESNPYHHDAPIFKLDNPPKRKFYPFLEE